MLPFFVTFASAAACASLLQAHQPKQAAPVHQQNGGKDYARESSQQQPTAPSRVAIEGPVTVVNQPDPNQQQRYADEQAQTRFENSVQVGTLVFVALAAFGAIGAYFANRRSANASQEQVRLLKAQITDAKQAAAEQQRIALDALVETRKSAEAAKVSADVATNALHISQRAWVNVVGIEFGPDREGVPTASFEIHNSGHQPASLTERAFLMTTGDEVPTDDSEWQWQGHAVVLPPGKTMPVVVPFNDAQFTPNNWRLVRSGHLRISVYGVFRYQTGFPDVPGETGIGFSYDYTDPNPAESKRVSIADAAGRNYAK